MKIQNNHLVFGDKEYLVLSGNPMVLPESAFQSCEIANGRECFGVGNLVLEVYDVKKTPITGWIARTVITKVITTKVSS